jgi:hypothetical protein
VVSVEAHPIYQTFPCLANLVYQFGGKSITQSDTEEHRVPQSPAFLCGTQLSFSVELCENIQVVKTESQPKSKGTRRRETLSLLKGNPELAEELLLSPILSTFLM